MEVSQHKNSPHEAFVAHYDEYADAIYRFCIVKVRNHDLALDLVQDTFIKTWEYLASGKNVDNIRAFLYRVARNLIIDNSRKKTTSSLDALTEEGFDPGHDATDQYIDATDAKMAMTRLGDLEEKHREILIMRYIDDLSISEIAEALETSENSVSVRIHRALDKARDIYKDHD